MAKKLYGYVTLLVLLVSLAVAFVPAGQALPSSFGRLTVGGSSVSFNPNMFYGSVYATGSDASGCIVSSVSWYGKATTTANVKALIVDASTYDVLAVSEGLSVGSTLNWYTNTFTNSNVLSATNNYVIGLVIDNYVSLYYDDIGSSVLDASNSYAAPQSLGAVTSGAHAFSIYATYTQPTLTLTSTPAIGANITMDSTSYGTPANVYAAGGSHSFTATYSLAYGGVAYTFNNWIINGSTTSSSTTLTLTLTGATTLSANYTAQAGVFHFYGPFDETTGLLLNENVTVTAHYSATSNIPNYSFVLNGSWVYPPDYNVQYFEYHFSDNSTRQYWVDPSELITDLYVFKVATPTYYVINFMDYTGVLKTYPYVTAKAYINGSLFTVEKRTVDEQNSLLINLMAGEKYQLTVGNQLHSFIYGDLLMTADTGVQLYLKGVDFPKETLLMYKYITLYGLRDFATNSILFVYNDTQSLTNSINVVFTDKNGVVAYNNTFVANSVVFNWTSAVNTTSYQLSVTLDHVNYGFVDWRQFFPNTAGEGAANFSFAFLGNWSFDMTYLFPAIIILFAAACFSALNAEVGAIVMVIVAAILSWMGWIPIPAGAIVAGFALAILMALVYNKRRIQA